MPRDGGACERPPLDSAGAANGYVAIEREWRTGDLVEVELPMTLRAEPLPGTSDVVAFVYGPIVLAGRLGREGLAPGNQIIVNERESGNHAERGRARSPRSAGDRHDADETGAPGPARPADVPHVGIGRPNDVELAPYYRLAHERYNLYWKIGWRY